VSNSFEKSGQGRENILPRISRMKHGSDQIRVFRVNSRLIISDLRKSAAKS
jgi:hypothetical protein